MKVFKEGQHRAAYAFYHNLKVKDFPKDLYGKSYEVHHIDGNHANNTKDNLILITIQEHYDIHFKQEDYWACTKILSRMKISREENSKLSSLLQKLRLSNGTHHFITNHPIHKMIAEGNHPGIASIRNRLKDGTHNFLGENNPSKLRAQDGTHHLLGNNPNHPGIKTSKTKVMSVLDGKITSKSRAGHWNKKDPAYIDTWVTL